MTAIAALPAPTPGSIRYFVLLYCPPQTRRRLQALLAIGDELAASLRPTLDHQIAHVRLAWWHEETQRLHHGQPVHPLTRELLADPAKRPPTSIELGRLVEMAMLTLARGTPDAAPECLPRDLQGELFAAAGQLLAEDLPPQALTALRELGGHVAALPIGTAPAPTAAAAAWYGPLATLPAILPRLAPLWVWAALAMDHDAHLARAPHRHRAGVSRRRTFADNIRAWRTARAAARGILQLE